MHRPSYSHLAGVFLSKISMRFASTVLLALSAVSTTLAASFTNPLRAKDGSDPFIVYSGDGYYYLLTTEWTNIQVTRSKTLGGLKTGETRVVWQDTTASRCCNGTAIV